MKLFLSFLAVVAAAVALIQAPGCMNDSSTNPYGGGPGPSPGPNTVVMSGSSFSPSSLTVPSGTTVTWKNNDLAVHTSTSDHGVWDTGDMGRGSSKTTTFNTPGTYHFHCTYHQAMGMTGTIVVQ